MATVEDRNKASIRRFYDEIINQGKVAVVDELMEPNFVHYGETLFPRIEGSAAIKAGVQGVINGYPDGHTTVEDLVAEGDTVVCLLSWRGTHRGLFMGVPRPARFRPGGAFPLTASTRREKSSNAGPTWM